MVATLLQKFGLFLIISVNANGELNILNHPASIQFKGHDHLRESLLSEVYSAALGFSTEEDSNWQGMYLMDPFNLAEAIVTVTVDGVSTLDISKGYNFPLRTDEDESEVYEALKRRVESRYPETTSNLIRIDLSEGLSSLEQYPELQNIKSISAKKATYNFLKPSIEEDKNFLDELAFLNSIAEQIEKGSIELDSIPDIFWFKVSALHALSDLHGSNSSATKEAKQLLFETIQRLNEAFQKLYSGNVIVSIVTSDASHTRRIRRALERPEEDYNLAEVYNDNYPVIFNIILWFGVAFVFSLLAITIFIASMDPGRDSIIYRMTSTRMKKDN
ncbi:Renin receptor-like protein [Popillia japonica]|uniref:Renin receptor-like protein n=1 Tax=Popillia japonica TaxID=7064 RepID=A0AAW1N1F5_POPJA